MRPIVAVAVLILLSGAASALERDSRLKVYWGSGIPEAPGDPAVGPPAKPLAIYVHPLLSTRDRKRFEEVVLANETALLALKFFDTVKLPEDRAARETLLEDVKYRAPALIVFDSTRKKHAVAAGRASAMKIYALLCKVGQSDYETSVAKTVRDARNLLATFDQIDAARDALGIKKGRLDQARADGKGARARKLENEIAAAQAKIDGMFGKATKRWDEIWTLRRKGEKK